MSTRRERKMKLFIFSRVYEEKYFEDSTENYVKIISIIYRIPHSVFKFKYINILMNNTKFLMNKS
jgi:hypothetical protein